LQERVIKAPEFLEFISETNQLDHHQRTLLMTTLNQLADEPKVYDLMNPSSIAKALVHTAHIAIGME